MSFRIRHVYWVALCVVSIASFVAYFRYKPTYRFDCEGPRDEIVYRGGDGNRLHYYEQRHLNKLIEIENGSDQLSKIHIMRQMHVEREKIALNGLFAMENSYLGEGWEFLDVSCRRNLQFRSIFDNRNIKLICNDKLSGFHHNIFWSKSKGIERFDTTYKDGFVVRYFLVSKIGLGLPCKG